MLKNSIQLTDRIFCKCIISSTPIQKEGRNENRVFSKYTNLHSGNGIHKKEIVTGHLLPGDKIPSVRELASELQVNPNTIQRTFQELERDGVVVTRREWDDM